MLTLDGNLSTKNPQKSRPNALNKLEIDPTTARYLSFAIKV